MSLVSDGSGAPSLAELAELYIESLREDAKARTDGSESVAWYPEDREKPPARVGDLWLTRGTSEDPPTLIAITWIGDGLYRAVVVLDEPELAAADDLLLSAEQCALGVPLALCAWRDLPVAEADLSRLVGSLPDAIVEPLAMLLQHNLTGGFRRRPLGSSRLSTGEGGVRWLIESSGDDRHAAEYLSGAPILSESDPRIRVRQELVRFTTYLEHNALQDLAVHAHVGEERAELAARLPWVSRLLQWFEQRQAPGQWEFGPLGVLRRFIEIPMGQLQDVGEPGAVLGAPTGRHELDLSYLLDELGVAADFESLKLIIKTGDQIHAAALLVPRRRMEAPVQRLLALEIRLLGPGGRPSRRERIVLHPGLQTRSRFVPLGRSADPSTFCGQLEVAIRELPPDVEDEDNN